MSDPLVEAIMTEWGWSGIDAAAVTAVSPFGHLIVQDKAGAFWYLDPELRTLERIATGKPGLFAHMNDPDVREVWEAHALVDRAHAKIGPPGPGRCYSLSIARLLEGDYEHDDFWHPPVVELIGAMGSIEQQLRAQGVADGAQVKLTVKD